MSNEEIHATEEVREQIPWPETLWPLDVGLITALPSELQPTAAELNQIKYPWELYELLMKKLAERVTQTRNIERVNFLAREQTFIEGNVWFGEGVTVRPHTTITGPAYIGNNVFIGDGTVARNVILLDRAHIGVHGDVAKSIMGERACAFHANRINQSVICQGARLMGGAVCAHYRMDGQPISSLVSGERVSTQRKSFGSCIGADSKVGGGVRIMPGAMIGTGCVIHSGVDVYKNVPDHTRVKPPRVEYEYSPIEHAE